MSRMNNRLAWTGSALLLTLSLAACGSSNSGSAKPSDSSAKPSASEAAAQQTNEATPSPSSRVVNDIFGEVRLPENPQRIVAPYVEDALVTLGVKPSMQWSLGELVQDYLQPYLQDVPKLDFTGGANLEVLLASSPDLILLYNKTMAENGAYEKFAKIAPTYAFEDATVDWKGTLRTLGDFLHKSDEAEKAIREYETKSSAAKEKLKPIVDGKTFAVIRVKPKEFLLMDGTYYSGPVLYGDLGLTPHKLVRELSWELNKPLSLEMLPELDADYIFLLVQGEAAKAKAKELTDSPIWQGLPAVKQNHVFNADISYWMSSGAIANTKKIDDVLKAVAP
ncbi:ABC transporter substrate-binding protein [Cohnella faecalis]|uniref:ABC transporter substrate-binding protein n=1 Tax=Cohnella faecalis TaxID=2315694 RepID=A0A398CH75_9BACL|nr:ABC transporter substrate-binding protein [Cohnella faecalis]RIE00449.1 ABC transporter substrate-binding protein [Cohnella faecalis]